MGTTFKLGKIRNFKAFFFTYWLEDSTFFKV